MRDFERGPFAELVLHNNHTSEVWFNDRASQGVRECPVRWYTEIRVHIHVQGSQARMPAAAAAAVAEPAPSADNIDIDNDGGFESAHDYDHGTACGSANDYAAH